MLVWPAVVLHDVPHLPAGEGVDRDHCALVPLIELGLVLGALPVDLDARAYGSIGDDDRVDGLGRASLLLGREQHERLRRGEFDLTADVVLRRARRCAGARELELVEGPDEGLERHSARRLVVHHVAGVIYAHEQAVGHSSARALPVGALVLVSKAYDAAPEDVWRHALLVAEVGNSPAVPLQPRGLPVLVGLAIVQVHGVHVRQGLEAPRFAAQVACRALNHRLGGPGERVHHLLRGVNALVLARGRDEHAHFELAFDASLERVAVDLGRAVELERAHRVPHRRLGRHDVREEGDQVLGRVRGHVPAVLEPRVRGVDRVHARRRAGRARLVGYLADLLFARVGEVVDVEDRARREDLLLGVALRVDRHALGYLRSPVPVVVDRVHVLGSHGPHRFHAVHCLLDHLDSVGPCGEAYRPDLRISRAEVRRVDLRLVDLGFLVVGR